ncbi:phospholipase D family protein [Cohnella sp. REN36]|uniref:phospholipase D family nuclease n=1 Tax=Cohnella sp. REN36 TaxID=2887347 RepID=UPI001D15E017|nr:phospholipase D family protein [Cohnella sp. REN36]MCC3375471.1 phospholipase D-like domain-containing protein [Cohnella sp. REN36]
MRKPIAAGRGLPLLATLLLATPLLATLLLGGCSFAGDKPSSASVTGPQLAWAFTQADQHPEQRLVEVIDGARRTLDVAIYSLTYPDIVQAIKNAKKRGVDVRLVTDRIQSGGKSQQEALKLLGSAGIPIKINRHSGLMHLKMTVADREVATTGSFNYSKSASTTNDEMLVVVRNPEVAAAFADEFERMWKDDKGFETITPSIAQPGEVVPPADEGSKDAKEEGGEEAAASVAPCTAPEIKGNINAKGDKIYHVPGGASYDRTKAEEMFCTEADAEAAGFRRASK